MKSKKYASVDQYIADFTGEKKKRLSQMRETIKKTAPLAGEKIGYNMPAYDLNGPLVYFAAFDKHIGFYATPTGHKAFEKELSGYQQGKGSVQFPHDEPLPLDLVKKIVLCRMGENSRRPVAKKKKN
jgi:uncharacterized protein YdhG (YjbR/CyaY superfamily)